MTRARENADGARLDAPLASPVLVTPNLGTPSAGVMTNVTGMPLAGLSATGTASATTYLRGDNSWQTAGSTDASDLDAGTLSTARMSAGTVIQQVSSLYEPSSDITTTSTTFVASSLYVTITPLFASSDIFMMFHLNGHKTVSAAHNSIVDIQRSINGAGYTQMGGVETYGFAHTYNANTTTSGFAFTDLDITGWSTGTIVYKLFWKSDNSNDASSLCRGGTSNSGMAMEIKR